MIKRACIIILLLTFPALCFANNMIRAIIGMYGSPYIVEETFNGTSTPTGWTDSGSPDHSNVGYVLVDMNEYVYCDAFSAISTFYAAGKVNFGSSLSQSDVSSFLFMNGAGTETVSVDSSDRASVYIDGTTTNSGAYTFSTSTDYYYWVIYTPETGEGNDDGVFKLYVNSSGDYDTATLWIDISDHSEISTVTYISISQYYNDSGDDFTFYHIIVNDEAIGDFNDD